jgi:Pyridoxal-phosphate dependent enzyme
MLSGQPTGSHRIEGIAIRLIPPPWDPALADRIEGVSSEQAQQMARRLAREEGLFAGTSTAANLVAALRVAETLGRGATVVTIAVDSGLRYLRTAPYADWGTRGRCTDFRACRGRTLPEASSVCQRLARPRSAQDFPRFLAARMIWVTRWRPMPSLVAISSGRSPCSL